MVAVLPLTTISLKVRKVGLEPYESTVVVVGCPEHLDAGDIIPKKMKLLMVLRLNVRCWRPVEDDAVLDVDGAAAACWH